MTNDAPVVPNHHADHPLFSGLIGWVAAQSMRVGRDEAARLAIDLVALRSGERLVDIGCGPGVAARAAAASGAAVTGVDPSEVMLRVARHDDRTNAISWELGTAESVPVGDESCEVAWSLSTVHHWRDVDAGVAEVRSILTPGGRFLATERRIDDGAHGLASHGWTDAQAESFAACCRHAGLTDVEVSSHAEGRRTTLAVRARR